TDNREPCERCRDGILGCATPIDQRQNREEADCETQFRQEAARRHRVVVASRCARFVTHRTLPDTPAPANVAMLWNKSSADSITFIASAAPVPSPSLRSRSRM